MGHLTVVTETTTGNSYAIVGECLIKNDDGSLTEAYLYRHYFFPNNPWNGLCNLASQTSACFCMEKALFNQKFERSGVI